MNLPFRAMTLPAALAAACLAAGCVGTGGTKPDSAADAKPAAAAAPSSKVGPGMNERGEVVDPKLVEAGYGQKVKGLGDWEGEITGRPAPGSRFGKLQIGMGMKQAMDIAGTPTDQGAYMTGKMFIPWYFGSDKHRYELVYKGQGRLIFASPGGFEMGAGNLIWIINSAAEQGYR